VWCCRCRKNSSIQQSRWQRQHNQRKLCKLAAALQQGAKQGKASKAAVSNNAKEHAQQYIKQNWEARDTNDGVSRNDIPARHFTKHLATTSRDMALSMNGGGSRLCIGWGGNLAAGPQCQGQSSSCCWGGRPGTGDGMVASVTSHPCPDATVKTLRNVMSSWTNLPTFPLMMS
jgi:hypothetical protein